MISTRLWPTDGPIEGRTDGWTDGWTDGQTDTPTYRDARMHLKNNAHTLSSNIIVVNGGEI